MCRDVSERLLVIAVLPTLQVRFESLSSSHFWSVFLTMFLPFWAHSSVANGQKLEVSHNMLTDLPVMYHAQELRYLRVNNNRQAHAAVPTT